MSDPRVQGTLGITIARIRFGISVFKTEKSTPFAASACRVMVQAIDHEASFGSKIG